MSYFKLLFLALLATSPISCMKRDGDKSAIPKPSKVIKLSIDKTIKITIDGKPRISQPEVTFDSLPVEIKTYILDFLVIGKGHNKAAQLYNAVSNIRAYLFAVPELLNNVRVNGLLINKLAEFNTRGNANIDDSGYIEAALALGTHAGGQWIFQKIDLTDRKICMEAQHHFFAAVTVGDIPAARFLLKFGQNQETIPLTTYCIHDMKPALVIAAKNGHNKMVKFLIKNGASVNKISYDGLTPLCRGICSDSKKLVHTLIDAGADVNQPETYGFAPTPLMCAVSLCDLELIEKILKAGAHATINALDTDGDNALWYANNEIEYENPEAEDIIKLLRAHGAVEQ